MKRGVSLAALCAIAGAVQAQNAPEISPADIDRLARLETTAGQALLDAFATGKRGDLDLLQDILAGAPVAPIATSLAGEWTCRTLKLGGGQAGLVAYAPFDCSITPDGAAFTIEKSSGTERLAGRIDLVDGIMVLTATGYVADAAPIPYAALTEETAATGSLWPVVGRVEQPAPDRIRILMPQPVLESNFDILDLRRKAAPPVEAVPDALPDTAAD